MGINNGTGKGMGIDNKTWLNHGPEMVVGVGNWDKVLKMRDGLKNTFPLICSNKLSTSTCGDRNVHSPTHVRLDDVVEKSLTISPMRAI